MRSKKVQKNNENSPLWELYVAPHLYKINLKRDNKREDRQISSTLPRFVFRKAQYSLKKEGTETTDVRTKIHRQRDAFQNVGSKICVPKCKI